MSQFYQGVTAGALPPSVPLIFPTDINSPAIPSGNTLNIVGASTGENNINGIQTDGDNGSNTVYIALTNRFDATVETSGGNTENIINFDLETTPGTFAFEVQVVAFESTTPASAGYNLFVTARTDGSNAFIVGTPDKIVNEDSALVAANVGVTTSGNAVIFQVTGVAGLNISWTTVGRFIFGGL